MPSIAKQTIENKNISFWQILLMIISTVVLINLSITYFNSFGPLYGSISALIALAICTVVCILIIYKKLSYYNYRIIDHELMLERAIGRSNYIYFHIDLNNIEYFVKYKDIDTKEKSVKTYKFLKDNNKENWYAIQFIKEKKAYRIIIEPDEIFLNAILQHVN